MENKKGSAFKAGFWYTISSIIVKSMAVLTTPFFTRLMTTSEYGYASTFISWHALLLTIFSLNLTYSIGRAKLDFPDNLDDYIGSCQILSEIVSAILCIVVIMFISPFSKLFELTETGTVLLLLYLFFGPAISFYQNGCRYRYIYKQNIGIAWYISLTTTVLSLILVYFWSGDKAIARMIGLTIPTVVLSIIIWVKMWKNNHLRINKEYWIYGWKLSGPLIIHTISLNILAQSDRIFITKFCGASDTGLYSLVYNYGMFLSLVTNSVAEGWLPWFHDTYYEGNFKEIRKNVKPLIIFGCFGGLACIALAPEAIFILGGKQYLTAINCVPPIVLGIVCQFIYTHYVNIEMHLKKTVYVSGGTIIAASINVILNYIFVPLFGFVAAAYTTLFSYIILMIIHFLITRLKFNVHLYNDKLLFLAFIITSIISSLLALIYSMNFVRYCVIAIGFAVFLIVFRDYVSGWINKMRKDKNPKQWET